MNNDVTTNEILEFLKENMVTKDEFRETLTEYATRKDLIEFRSDILESVDRFAKLHETLDQELLMLRSKYNRLEERLELIETKIGITV
ncbi:TPA: hypothetical protein DCW61_04715 [Candidatus Uhrbacteria bacterium]|nr:hypothetical protein [Candidatus Uhrbacteria bacterium]